MKKLFVAIFFVCVYKMGFGQTIRYIHFASGTDVVSISFITDQKIILKTNFSGKLLEWGNELEPGRFYSTPGRLQPYMGRVEYYEKQFDTILNGKLKSIGTTTITYYGSYENAALVGKVKSIGSLWFDYYTDFENEALRGKLKSAGSKTFTWYNSFDNDSFKGKLKSVGGSQITYYSSFDDNRIRGKLKSIGSQNYVWHTSITRGMYVEGLKSGYDRQTIEGIMYIIW